MGRFLVSLSAGILVILGGWVGWSRAGTVDDLLADASSVAAPSTDTTSSTGGAASPLTTDPDTSISLLDSPASPPCSRPRPVGAAGMNRLMEQLDGEPRLQGGDHGGSAALADGRRLFVYGDTIRDPVTVSPFMVRNSALVANRGCVTALPGPSGDAFIPDDSDNTGYWPMSLRSVAVTGGTQVQIITNRVRQTGDASVFQTLGSSLVTVEVPTGRMPQVVDQQPLAADSKDPRIPTWGAAMWDHDDHVYVFGTASNETKTTAGWSLHVARTTPDELGDMDRWEYWDGTRWAVRSDVSAHGTAELIPAEQGVSHVLSVFERDGSWYAVSKEGDFQGRSLAVWKSPSVTGPWTKHIIEPLENSDGIQRYTPLAHPDFVTPAGTLLISWSESPVDHGLYRTDPHMYRPRFQEIILP
ncbi:hypothetical protein ASG73_07115 [Janibacter sp. Soil728]|uniref:DUF4185 domain-containing protein n=1 Tax=Janibacter sp. Soil728 TaxID=1736393 RepID=UPI0006FB9841|nr:DUF4185 domain-containing protein [Janibacter sp. Soil728]KRE37445.1 hypothetical protein ASG73_07115 [Janibacter sp. Soil728]